MTYARFCSLLVLLATPCFAGGVSLARLVGTGDPVPGASGVFFTEVHSAHIAGQWMVARGYSATESGLYAWHEGVGWPVVSRFSPLPGIPPGSELRLENPIYYAVDSSGLVVFAVPWHVIADPDINGVGVWVWQNGQTDVVVLSGQVVAGSDLPYLATTNPTVDSGVVYLAAIEGPPSGYSFALYRWQRSLGVERVLGTGFQTMALPSAAGGRVAFLGLSESGVLGFWSAMSDGSDVQVEHDFSTPFPLGPPGSSWELISGPFTPIATAPPTTFGARSSGDFERHGLYRLRGDGGYELLYDGSEADPTSGLAHLGIVPGLAGSGENVAFMLRDPTQMSTLGRRLVVRDAGGRYHLIAAEGEDFEGLPVGLIEFTQGAMAGDRLAFNVLRPNDGAVWVADFGPTAPSALEIPTLGIPALGLLAMGLAAAASRVLRHRRFGSSWRGPEP